MGCRMLLPTNPPREEVIILSPDLAKKMMRVRDLRLLREAYLRHLEDPDNLSANKLFVKFKCFCLSRWGDSETLIALQEAERIRKVVHHV